MFFDSFEKKDFHVLQHVTSLKSLQSLTFDLLISFSPTVLLYRLSACSHRPPLHVIHPLLILNTDVSFWATNLSGQKQVNGTECANGFHRNTHTHTPHQTLFVWMLTDVILGDDRSGKLKKESGNVQKQNFMDLSSMTDKQPQCRLKHCKVNSTPGGNTRKLS